MGWRTGNNPCTCMSSCHICSDCCPFKINTNFVATETFHMPCTHLHITRACRLRSRMYGAKCLSVCGGTITHLFALRWPACQSVRKCCATAGMKQFKNLFGTARIPQARGSQGRSCRCRVHTPTPRVAVGCTLQPRPLSLAQTSSK